MTAQTNQHCRLLADAIADFFCGTIHAGSDVIDYIDSAYGNPSAAELKAAVEQPGGSERETLVELIFFPDLAVQQQLEGRLEQHDFTAEEVEAVAADLSDRSLQATVLLEGTGQQLQIPVDRSVIDPFLTRLNITCRFDENLQRTIEEVFSTDTRKAVRVCFRNAQSIPTGSLLVFLQRWLRAVGEDDQLFESLEFLLAFLQQIDQDADIFEALTIKKRTCWRHLHKVQRAEEKWQRANMETLLLGGERFPHVDKDQMRRSIALIDRICLTVFGKTGAVDAAGPQDEGWEIRNPQDAAAMIRLLS